MHAPTPTATVASPVDDPTSSRRRSSMLIVAMLVVALVVTVFGAVNQLVFAAEQEARNTCYQQAIRQINDSLAVGRDASKQDREQLRILVTALIDPDRTPEETRAALDRYRVALDDADRRRSTAPLPDIRCS